MLSSCGNNNQDNLSIAPSKQTDESTNQKSAGCKNFTNTSESSTSDSSKSKSSFQMVDINDKESIFTFSLIVNKSLATPNGQRVQQRAEEELNPVGSFRTY